MEPKNESLTNKKLTEVETNEAKKPTKKDPKETATAVFNSANVWRYRSKYDDG